MQLRKLGILGVAAALATAIPALPGASTPAHADTAGSPAYQCIHSNGVWIVVAIRGQVSTQGCYHGTGTGLDALNSITATKLKPDGLICRINGFPSGPPEPPICNPADKTTSPFWFYYLKTPADSDWQFSNWGAQNRNVVPGTIEGWNYGTGLYPFAPPPTPDLTAPAAAAPPPAAQPPTNATTQPGSTNPAPGTQPAGDQASTNAGSSAPGPAGSPATQSASAGASASSNASATPSAADNSAPATPGAGEGSATPAPAGAVAGSSASAGSAPAVGVGNTGQASSSGSGSGSPVGLLVTLGVVAVAAGGGGGWYWWRRRRGVHVR